VNVFHSSCGWCCRWLARCITPFISTRDSVNLESQCAKQVNDWIYCSLVWHTDVEGNVNSWVKLLLQVSCSVVQAALTEGRQWLHSALSGYLMVPRTLTSVSQRAFTVWNKLPAPLQSMDTALQTLRPNWRRNCSSSNCSGIWQHWPALLWLLQRVRCWI